MHAQTRHERRESLEERQRLEHDRAGRVAPGTPQPVGHPTVGSIERPSLAMAGGAM